MSADFFRPKKRNRQTIINRLVRLFEKDAEERPDDESKPDAIWNLIVWLWNLLTPDERFAALKAVKRKGIEPQSIPIAPYKEEKE